MERTVVIQADARRRAAGVRSPLSVGVARWRGEGRVASVVAKVTLQLTGDRAAITEPMPVSGSARSELDGADSELSSPDDFVLHKPLCDLVVVGHAHGAAPSESIEARLTLDDTVAMAMVAHARPAASAIPLVARHVEGASPWPKPIAREATDDGYKSFDFARLQCAERPQVIERLGTMIVDNLTAGGGERTIALPDIHPRIFLRERGEELAMSCDTIVFDTDFERLAISWRSEIVGASQLVGGIDASLERRSSARPVEAVLGDLPRGGCSFALEEDPRDEGDPDELDLAAYEALEHVADPELSLADYARVGAELAEGDRSRQEVLEAHELDERAWTIEERAWLDDMGEGTNRGDASLAVEYGELFVAAQDALAGPGEPMDLDRYAEIRAAVERQDEPAKALSELSVTQGQWMRAERHWRGCVASDPDLAARMVEALAGHRS